MPGLAGHLLVMRSWVCFFFFSLSLVFLFIVSVCGVGLVGFFPLWFSLDVVVVAAVYY